MGRIARLNDRSLDMNHSVIGLTDPWRGLAAMVLIQAAHDIEILRGEESTSLGGDTIRMEELVRFFHSDWAEFLGMYFDLDSETLINYCERMKNGGWRKNMR